MSYKGLTQEMLERLCESYGRHSPACVKPLTLPYIRCVESPRIPDEARNPGTRIIVIEEPPP